MIYPSKRDERAISDVIGSILMVAVVVMVVLTIGMTILAQNAERPEQVYADVTFEDHDDHAVTIQWTGQGNADHLEVTNGTTSKNISSFQSERTMAPSLDGHDIEVWAVKNEHRSLVTKYSVPDYRTGLYMESSACDGPEYCGSTIVYNGTEIFSQRGVNIIVLDENGEFYSHAWFDTHSGDRYKPESRSLSADGTPEMNPTETCTNCVNPLVVNHLDGVESGYTVILVGGDQPGRTSRYPNSDTQGINDEVEAEYEKLGAQFSGDDILEHRDSWILVSVKDGHRVFEKHAPSGEKVTAYYFAGREDE